MGYRSDVAYTIRFTPEYAHRNLPVDNKPMRDAFFTFIAEAKSKPATELAMKEVHVNEDTLQLNFYCESVKWYDSFHDVESHEQLVSLAREWVADCPYIGVIYSRVGEELEDMDYQCDGNYDYEWIQLHRSIDLDWTPAS
mgnify:CR=1 FL=1